MQVKLQDIPGLSDEFQTAHRIKSISLGGVDRTRVALCRWQRDYKTDWKKIMKAIRYVGTTERKKICNQAYVKKCDNPKYGDIYEFRANRCKLRLFFFYDPTDETIVICTNDFIKNDSRRGKSGGQDAAFALCAEMKKIYIRKKQ